MGFKCFEKFYVKALTRCVFTKIDWKNHLVSYIQDNFVNLV